MLLQMKKTILEGLLLTEQLIDDIVFMCESRMKSTYFTRAANCKMDLKNEGTGTLFCLL